MNRILFILFIATGFTLSLSAQTVPQGFNYQSIVRDDNGNPLANQTITMLLTIRSGAPNGPVAYSEKQVASTNEYGLINLIIGQGGTALQGTFAGINWGGGAKYLTVSVETSPNVFDELGSSQLMSVPYAIYAQSAGSGGGGTGDNWGNQVVQTGAALQGNGTAASPINLAPQGAQPGQVLKWDGAKWVPQDDVVSTGTGGGTVTQVSTGPGLSGGPITTSGTISLENTGVTPGTYGSASQIPVFTVDAQGRVTQVFTTVVSPGNPVAINAGTGIQVLQQGTTFTINNTGDTNANDDLSATSQAGGDVAGPFSNLQLQANTVGSAEISDNAVGSSEILDNAVGSAEIAANAVGSAEIAPDAVNSSEIADDAVGSTELADGAVTTVKLANAAVTNAKIADGTIGAEKLSDMGANPGQVLKWDGSSWGPAVDLSGGGGGTLNLNEGPGIEITGSSPNLTITNTGDTNPNDDITTAIQANGDITGVFSNLQIKANAVGSTEIANEAVTSSEIADESVATADIADGAVTGTKIDDMGADAGQVLKFNGSSWAPANDNGGGGGSITLLAGPGIDVDQSASTFTITNTGDPNAADDLTTGTAFNGDVTGTFDNLQIKASAVSTAELANGAVTGPKIDDMNAGIGQVLKWTGLAWAPANDLTGGLIGGDNWGTQVAITGNGLQGDGTNANPLELDPQGAVLGQVLKFNGSTWVPANDVGSSYTAGAGINIAGTTISNTGDLSNTNEIQTISLSGNQLSLSNGGGSVNLPSGGGNNYSAGAGISITGSSPNFTINNTGDLSGTNELQNLNLSGSVLTISGTNSSVDFGTLLGTSNVWKMDGGNIFNLNPDNVLIGTSNNVSGRLQVVGGGAEAGRFTNNGSSPTLYASNLGSGPALVTGMGNVGINTASPAFRLDVAGNQRILSTGAQPQLTLEQGGSDYARLAMKGAGGGRVWTLEGSSSGSNSEFHLDVASAGGVGKVRFIRALNDAELHFGDPAIAPVNVVLYHEDKGLKLEHFDSGDSWEFQVNPANGSLVLRANGNVAGSFAQNGTYTASDRRLKKDIASMTGVLHRLMNLQPVVYHYRQETASDKLSYGFLAQDVQPLFPELVGQIPGPDGQGDYLAVNYGGFSVLAVRAIQEQQQQIKTLQSENEALRQRMEALEARMQRIEKALEEK